MVGLKCALRELLLVLSFCLLLLPFTNSAHLSTSGNQIVNEYGDPVRLAGVNFFGFESVAYILYGLWVRNYADMMDQQKALGFNCLRIPISQANIRDPRVEPWGPGLVDYAINPEFEGKTSFEALKIVVAYATSIEMRIMLDYHSCLPGQYFNESLWYIPSMPDCSEERWIETWEIVAAAFSDTDTIIGYDLFNEPKNLAGQLEPTWGDGVAATDWAAAATRCATAIQAIDSSKLIVIEGIARYAPTGFVGWWGAVLNGVETYTLNLTVANKLVYSVHDYPKSVFAQTWFNDPQLELQLAYWKAAWGNVFFTLKYPMFIGEFGSRLEGTDAEADKYWLQLLLDYMNGDELLDGGNSLETGQLGMSFCWWCWSPNSDDTGGILEDDWFTVRTDKMAYLADSLAPLSLILSDSPVPTAVPTATPSAAPSFKSTLLVSSFELHNLTDIYAVDSVSAAALERTIESVLGIPLGSTSMVAAPAAAAAQAEQQLRKGRKLLAEGPFLAYAESTVSIELYSALALGSSLRVMTLFSMLDVAVADGSFSALFQTYLKAALPDLLVDEVDPTVVDVSLGYQDGVTPAPSAAPTAAINSNSNSATSSGGDNQTNLIVVSVVVGITAIVIAIAAYLCLVSVWHSDNDAIVAATHPSSTSEAPRPSLITRLSSKSGGGLGASSKKEAAVDLDAKANKAYQKSLLAFERDARKGARATDSGENFKANPLAEPPIEKSPRSIKSPSSKSGKSKKSVKKSDAALQF